MTHSLSAKHTTPSIIGGTMIVGGAMIGGGMFALPVVMSGAWFLWSLLVLVFTWFCMLHSGLMILEANLHYRVGASFATIVDDLLGRGWNIVNGLSVAFVMYLLTYAYTSASGKALQHTLAQMHITLSAQLSGLIFALLVACVVWRSTRAVSRFTTLLLGAKILTFFITFGTLLWQVRPAILLNSAEANAHYLPYVLATLPFCLATFGFHTNVPSLMKFYGKQPRTIFRCILYGTLIALVLYAVWLAITMGNLPRTSFITIRQQGGNIDTLVRAVSGLLSHHELDFLLMLFSNFAVTCSFLSVTLGLFDYLADLCKFNDSTWGRFKSMLVTFVPPIIAVLIWPDGFIYAIGFSGLAGAVLTAIVPALLVRASRKRFHHACYRVWGGNSLIVLIMGFGIGNIVIHTLSLFHLLPVYG